MAHTEDSAETKENNGLRILNLVHLSNGSLELLLGDVGTSGVDNLNDLEKSATDKMGRIQSTYHLTSL